MHKRSAIFLGIITILILACAFLVYSCGQTSEKTAPVIASRSPALNATSVSPSAALSLTANYAIATTGITKDNLLTDYADYGTYHTAGTPELSGATLSWSNSNKTLSLEGISGWSGISVSGIKAASAATKIVHIVARAAKIVDLDGASLATSTDLWKYGLAASASTTSTTSTSTSSTSSTSTTTTTTTTTTLLTWRGCFGGSGYDWAESIQQTTDEGFVAAGTTTSNDGDNSGLAHGSNDFWVIKVNSGGSLTWRACLGGSSYDYGTDVQQTADGGYVVVGYTMSTDDQVVGNNGSMDAWVVKLDSGGNIDWKNCWGGTHNDYGLSISQTSDNGYIMAGYTMSNDVDVSGNHGKNDIWVVKLNSGGGWSWGKCLGGVEDDYAYSIEQTSDGGYIVAGYSNSTTGEVTGNHGSYDYWVVKLDASGNITWSNSLGGSGIDMAYSVTQTLDGGYIVAGKSYSNDNDVSGNHGSSDYWVVKLDASGDLDWQRSLGGSSADTGRSIQQTSDGGYLVAGESLSNDHLVSGNHGSGDYWVVKLDAGGNITSQRCWGGSLEDYGYSIQETSDGGYIVSGFAISNDDDVSGNNGNKDFWLIKN